MHRRSFLKAACAGLALSYFPASRAAVASSGTITLSAAINKAGRQRMLSQRMAKAWLMLDMDVLPERARPILKQSMALFESQLAELGSLMPSEEVKRSLAQLGEEWRAYKAVLGTAPSADGAKRLFDANEKVLALAHGLTLGYEKLAATPAGRLVNLAGRQRMLSQRMAKFYLFRQAGVNTAVDQSELDKARREFTAAHATLLAAPQNTGPIRTELDLVGQQWMFFQVALDAQGAADQPRSSAAVATTSERILEQMENAVGLYERLAS